MSFTDDERKFLDDLITKNNDIVFRNLRNEVLINGDFDLETKFSMIVSIASSIAMTVLSSLKDKNNRNTASLLVCTSIMSNMNSIVKTALGAEYTCEKVSI